MQLAHRILENTPPMTPPECLPWTVPEYVEKGMREKLISVNTRFMQWDVAITNALLIIKDAHTKAEKSMATITKHAHDRYNKGIVDAVKAPTPYILGGLAGAAALGAISQYPKGMSLQNALTLIATTTGATYLTAASWEYMKTPGHRVREDRNAAVERFCEHEVNVLHREIEEIQLPKQFNEIRRRYHLKQIDLTSNKKVEKLIKHYEKCESKAANKHSRIESARVQRNACRKLVLNSADQQKEIKTIKEDLLFLQAKLRETPIRFKKTIQQLDHDIASKKKELDKAERALEMTETLHKTEANKLLDSVNNFTPAESALVERDIGPLILLKQLKDVRHQIATDEVSKETRATLVRTGLDDIAINGSYPETAPTPVRQMSLEDFPEIPGETDEDKFLAKVVSCLPEVPQKLLPMTEVEDETDDSTDSDSDDDSADSYINSKKVVLTA